MGIALNIENVIGIISQVPKLVTTIAEIVDGVKDALSEDDKNSLELALAAMMKENDEAFSRISAKLQAATQKE